MRLTIATFLVALILLGCKDNKHKTNKTTLTSEEKLIRGENENNNIAENKVQINGKIENFKTSDSLLKISINTFELFGNGINKKFEIDSLGNFQIDLEIEKPTNAFLNFDKNNLELLLVPGEKLNIIIENHKNVKKIVLESDVFSINNSLNECNEVSFNFESYYSKYNTLNPIDFKIFNDSVYKYLNSKCIDRLYHNKNTNVDLKDWLYVNKYILPLKQYISYSTSYSSKITKESYKPSRIDELILNDFKVLDSINNKHLRYGLFSRGFIHNYNRYIDLLVEEIYGNGKKIYLNQLEPTILSFIIDRHEKNKLISQLLIEQRISSTIANNRLEDIKKATTIINDLYKNSEFESYIINKIEGFKSKIENLSLKDGVEIMEFKSKSSNDYLNEIISKANGKVIYIDSWATWCGPCITEFKDASPNLRKKFKDDIEFIYLCFKSEKDLWLRTVKEYNLKGKHYFVDKKTDKSLLNQLKIYSFPTYSIINKEGQVFYTGNEYKPSSGIKVEELFDKLLKK